MNHSPSFDTKGSWVLNSVTSWNPEQDNETPINLMFFYGILIALGFVFNNIPMVQENELLLGATTFIIAFSIIIKKIRTMYTGLFFLTVALAIIFLLSLLM